MTTPAPVKKFISKRDAITFEIDDDTFKATRTIPADTVVAFTSQAEALEKASGDFAQQYEIIKEILGIALLPESQDLFKKRLKDNDNPIDFDMLIEVVTWLIGEVMGGFPTPPLLSSTDTPELSGTPLTDGAPVSV